MCSETWMYSYMDTNESLFHHHWGFIKGPPWSSNLHVGDLPRVRWTSEMRAGTFYQIILWWFARETQSDRLDVKQRRKHSRDLDLIRHYPAFEVTSLCMFELWPRSTRSFFISQDEIEPQPTLVSHPVHTDSQTHAHTEQLHSYLIYPYHCLGWGMEKHYGF